ncbi:hypothetical protein EDB80DRAFT_96324, partial [Ilyonectria destructans]
RETLSNHRSAHVASTSILETTLGHNGGRGIPHEPTIARCPSSARRLPATPCGHFGIISARRNRNHQGPHSFTHSVTPSPCFSLPSRLPGPHGPRHSHAPDSGRKGEAINLSRALARLKMAICLKIIIFDTEHRYPPWRPQESNDCQPVASAKLQFYSNQLAALPDSELGLDDLYLVRRDGRATINNAQSLTFDARLSTLGPQLYAASYEPATRPTSCATYRTTSAAAQCRPVAAITTITLLLADGQKSALRSLQFL